ncbi:MAG: PspC domain-containing protein [Saccharospirillaceae bacterium]|nr:PspC domain-containing protein [Pseudomonadales bacterium]NRB78045.1 PspC domain-containing protein [Saccharospirillaceae bacterium]
MHHRHNRRTKFNNKEDFKEEYSRQRSRQKRKAAQGYGINLYRNKTDNMIAGVCSGLGDHFGIDYKIFRIIFVVAFFMVGGFPMIIAYLLCWILIEPRSKDGNEAVDIKVEYDEKIRDYRPKTVFSKKEGSKVRIDRTRMRIRKAKRRIEDMERYVTSKKFKMEQEFSEL